MPYPEFVPVEVPRPAPDTTRVPQTPLPADPCTDPCPETAPESAAPIGDDPRGSGSSGSSFLPRVEIDPRPETIPIPVPGGEPPAPQPAPNPVAPTVEPGPAVGRLGTPEVGAVSLVSQLTGPGSENRTDARWQVNGTDLGIFWRIGAR